MLVLVISLLFLLLSFFFSFFFFFLFNFAFFLFFFFISCSRISTSSFFYFYNVLYIIFLYSFLISSIHGKNVVKRKEETRKTFFFIIVLKLVHNYKMQTSFPLSHEYKAARGQNFSPTLEQANRLLAIGFKHVCSCLVMDRFPSRTSTQFLSTIHQGDRMPSSFP